MKKLINWVQWNLETEHLIVIGIGLFFVGAIVYSCITATNPCTLDAETRMILSL